MKAMTITYPDDLAEAVQLTEAELDAQLRLMAALKMFELGKLSSGKAAELAGMTRVQFMEACGMYRVPIYNYSEEEVASELQSDLNTLQDKAA